MRDETVEIDLPEPGPSSSPVHNSPHLKTFIAPLYKKPPAAVEARFSLQISSAPLADLIPLPKSTQKWSSNRKHKKSEVISSLPYKRQVEDKNEQKNKTKPEPRPKKKVTKPKANNNRKIWRCGGYNEVYKEPIFKKAGLRAIHVRSGSMKSVLITMAPALLFRMCAYNIVSQSYRSQRAILHFWVYKISQFPIRDF